MFGIEFVEPRPGQIVGEYDLDHERPARIVLGDFSEFFLASVRFWSPDDYRRQWCDGLTKIAAGAEKVFLVTDYAPPEAADLIMWWPVYRLGTHVLFRNQVLIFDQLSQPFRLEEAEIHVANYVPGNPDGVSEWQVRIEDILQFLEQLCHRVS